MAGVGVEEEELLLPLLLCLEEGLGAEVGAVPGTAPFCIMRMLKFIIFCTHEEI